MFPAKAGFKVKSKIPDFEPVEAKRRSRPSGTPRLGKRGRFSKASKGVRLNG